MALTRAAREARLPIRGTSLFCREVGEGPPLVVLHGGPDFDHHYLLPHLDALADDFRLIYYDQRGRGRSSGAGADDLTIASEIADLEGVRTHFDLARIAVLGHSWGAVLALEYAIRHEDRLSHLILMNPAPASSADLEIMQRQREEHWPEDMARKKAIAATAAFRSGDPAAEAAYYRIHYGRGVPAPELEPLLQRMRAHFTREGILRARRIEDRLMRETWASGDYDLIPALQRLTVPALVLHGDSDFVPLACAARIADAISGGRLAVVPQTGHFSYLERPEEVHRLIAGFCAA